MFQGTPSSLNFSCQHRTCRRTCWPFRHDNNRLRGSCLTKRRPKLWSCWTHWSLQYWRILLQYGVSCLDAAVWVAFLDNVERRERGLRALNVQRGQRWAACNQPLNPCSGDLGTVHEIDLVSKKKAKGNSDLKHVNMGWLVERLIGTPWFHQEKLEFEEAEKNSVTCWCSGTAEGS